MLRILLADDDVNYRRELRFLLSKQPDLKVVGEADTGLSAVTKTLEVMPDVVVMDVAMPELDGIKATRQILAALSMT